METRKLQKIGGSTYSVSLPKEWATEHRLEAGMPIHLYPHTDGSLVVRSTARDGGPLSATTVTLPAADADAAERVLRAAYAVGYDTVTLVAPDDEELAAAERRAVRRLVRSMIGLSVVEETTDRLTVENLLDASEVSIRQSVVQIQYTALSMHRTAVERLERRATADAPETDPLDERDDEVDRLFEMLTRHFNRSLADLGEIDDLDVHRPELFDYYLVAHQLERVADHAVRIGALADRIDQSVDADLLAEVVALAAAARDVVETAMAAVLDPSAERAHEALDRWSRVIDDARALDRVLFEESSPGACACSRVLSRVVRAADCGGTAARVALRRSLRPEA
jgi:phosphate uptake regulator